MRPTTLRLLVVLVVSASIAAACATEAGVSPLGNGTADGGWDFEGELEDRLDQPIAPDTDADDQGAPTSDEVVEAALLDVEAFWARSYADVYGTDYEPVSGGFWAYGPDTEQPPCGTPPPEYADIAENAFYCPEADLIAWDNVNLVPGLYEEFQAFTLGLVFAHEFGHAIQARAGVLGGDTILIELQADCFAGAWARDVEAGNAEFFELTPADLDLAIAGFLTLRDGVGTSAADPAAHGTGFDRVGSFSEGYEQGLDHCATYPDLYATGQLVIVEVPFTDQEDFERGGNLPLDQVVDLAIADLEDFWTVLFDELGAGAWTPIGEIRPVDPDVDEVTCGSETYAGDVLVNAAFYCVPSNTIVIDAVNLVPALYEIGDYAVAIELARQYAYAAQVQLGNEDASLAANLQADCFAGLYASSGFLVNRENQQLVLSPGDLDEAVIAFLKTSDESEAVEAGNATVGTAFTRFDAFRSGFVEGTTACDALLAGG